MSFFEIEPMGARHYGGINVGGMPVGGMTHLPQYGGMPVGGGPISGLLGMFGLGDGDMYGGVFPKRGEAGYEELRAKIADARAKKKAFMAGRRAQLKAEGYTAKEQMSISRTEWEASRVKPRKPKRGEEGYVQRPRKGQEGYRPPKLSQVATLKSRISRGKNGSSLTSKRITNEDLETLADFLAENGYGIHDLDGGAWYDDLWSGVKQGVGMATQIAPHLLPLLL